MNNEYDVTSLYKYRDLDESSLNCIERIFTHRELYFSKPLDFNDPFECQPRFSFKATKKEQEAYLKTRLPTYMPNLNRQNRRLEVKKIIKEKKLQDPKLSQVLENVQKDKIIMNTGVFCLSEIPDHILMWSHYGGAHTGICIEFEATSHTPFFGLAQQVHYQSEYPVINIIKDSHEDLLRKALLSKSKHWSYEKEWRIAWHDSPPGVYNFPQGLIKSVILGARISDQNKNKVISWISSSGGTIEVSEASLKRNTYGININRV